VRAWLARAGLRLAEERLALERGRFYVALAAERGASPPAAEDLGAEDLLEVGPRLLESGDPLVASFWRRREARLSGLVAEASRARDGSAAPRLAASLEQARRVREALARRAGAGSIARRF
jgi:tRNA A22 N-methylase